MERLEPRCDLDVAGKGQGVSPLPADGTRESSSGETHRGRAA